MEKTFAEHFKEYIAEDMTTADAGVGATNVTGEPKQGDFYAPNDTRIPKMLGKVDTRKGVVGKKGKSKKKKNKSKGINGVFLKGENEEEVEMKDNG